ncbi:hypothetical protein [Vibrio mangrovi]|uniref:Uncharacterized protein n=1 Tax=Vibrio mangrovi TaxID=474394 RepID=A0A1Y6IVE3_9VIBR|nr:hypothetical protein [Vibrio mangrovi]MDW6004690.1 hypothetical protein [Vibrio mangrovi]SMS00981.1 hypothetical protein VIM7927_02258 [Vibrio mangrovi]
MQRIGSHSIHHHMFSNSTGTSKLNEVRMSLGRYAESHFHASQSLLNKFMNGGSSGHFWNTFKPGGAGGGLEAAHHQTMQNLDHIIHQSMNNISKLVQQFSEKAQHLSSPDHQVLTPRPQISSPALHAAKPQNQPPAGYPGTESGPRIFTPRPKISFANSQETAKPQNQPPAGYPGTESGPRIFTPRPKVSFSNPQETAKPQNQPPAGYPGTESGPRIFTPRPKISFTNPQETAKPQNQPPAGYPGTDSEPRIFTPRPQVSFTSPHFAEVKPQPQLHATPPEPEAFHQPTPQMGMPGPEAFHQPPPQMGMPGPEAFHQPPPQMGMPGPEAFHQPPPQMGMPGPEAFHQPPPQMGMPGPEAFHQPLPQMGMPGPEAFHQPPPQMGMPEPAPFYQSMPQAEAPGPQQTPQVNVPGTADASDESALQLYVPQSTPEPESASAPNNQPGAAPTGNEGTQQASATPDMAGASATPEAHSPAVASVLDGLKSFTGQKEYVLGGQLQMRPAENKENLKRELIAHLVDQMENSVKNHGGTPQDLQKAMFFQTGGYEGSPLFGAIEQNGNLQHLASENEALGLSKNDVKQVIRAAHFSFSSRMNIPRNPEANS